MRLRFLQPLCALVFSAVVRSVALPVVLSAIVLPHDAQADPIVIIGDLNGSGQQSNLEVNRKDPLILKQNVCDALTAADKMGMGHEVLLLAPTVTCGSKVYTGACNGVGCEPDEIPGKLDQFLKSKVKEGVKQNLIVETVGHGGTYQPGEGTSIALGVYGTSKFSARQLEQTLSKLLNSEAHQNKIQSVKLIANQCYGGGFLEVANSKSLKGRVCGVSAAPYNRQALVNAHELEYKQPDGTRIDQPYSEFSTRFWESQTSAPGGQSPSLEESLFRPSSKLALSNPKSEIEKKKIPSYDLWRRTSEQDWRARDGSFTTHLIQNPEAGSQEVFIQSPMESPWLLEIYQEGLSAGQLMKKSFEQLKEKNADLYRENPDGWFESLFKDVEAPKELDSQLEVQCSSRFQTKFNANRKNFQEVLNAMQARINGAPHTAFSDAESEKRIRERLQDWMLEYQNAQRAFVVEMKTYTEEFKQLKKESDEFMTEWFGGTKGRTKSGATRDQNTLKNKYNQISAKMEALNRLDRFPAIQKMIGIEGSLRHLTHLTQQLNSSRLKPEEKKKIIATWECENSPVFLNKRGQTP